MKIQPSFSSLTRFLSRPFTQEKRFLLFLDILNDKMKKEKFRNNYHRVWEKVGG